MPEKITEGEKQTKEKGEHHVTPLQKAHNDSFHAQWLVKEDLKHLRSTRNPWTTLGFTAKELEENVKLFESIHERRRNEKMDEIMELKGHRVNKRDTAILSDSHLRENWRVAKIKLDKMTTVLNRDEYKRFVWALDQMNKMHEAEMKALDEEIKQLKLEKAKVKHEKKQEAAQKTVDDQKAKQIKEFLAQHP